MSKIQEVLGYFGSWFSTYFFHPQVSYIDQNDLIEVDPDTKEMLKMLVSDAE